MVADAVAITSPLTLTDRFDWSPTLPGAGEYSVYAKWQAATDRATDATYEVTHSGGVATVAVDQRHSGGEWRYLGTWSFDPSQSPKVSLLASLNGTVNADAVRFVSGDAIGGEIAYGHGDQLGTIQKLTDASGTVIWDRVARPFGETVSINAATGIEQKLRFAGQFADETGLSYNYFRDHDPTLGRYAQSDPIGLDGGVNTYAYVGGNPLGYIDPLGLFSLRDGLGFVPILGSGLDAYDAFKCGNIGLGLFNTGLALLDATGVGAIAKGLTVGAFKLGARSLLKEVYKSGQSMAWGRVRARMLEKGLVTPNVPTHHWLFHQAGNAPDWIKNSAWNLMPDISKTIKEAHYFAHHGKAYQKFWYGTPDWFKTALSGGTSYLSGLFAGSGSDCECQ